MKHQISPRSVRIAPIVIGVVLLAYGGFRPLRGDEQEPSPPPPLKLKDVGSPQSLCVFWSTGMKGEIEPCGCTKNPLGGMARRGSFLHAFRAGGNPMLHLEGGDLLFRSLDLEADYLPQADHKAEMIVDTLNSVGTDAFAPGEIDFARGVPRFLELRARAKFPWLSANLRAAGKDELLLEPSIILERGAFRIGVFGLTDPVHLLRLTDVEATSMEDAAREQVAKLQAEKVDFIIALVHSTRRGGETLMKQVPGIDLLAGVHGEDIDYHPNVDRTPTMQIAESSYPRGKSLGGRQIYLQQGRGANGQYPAFPIPLALSNEFPDEPKVRALIDTYVESLALVNAVPLQALEDQRPGKYLSAEACAKCHTEQVATWSRTRHASAWTTLQAVRHASDLDCIGCHSVGIDTRLELADPALVARFAGVQCEVCHGSRVGHPENPAATRSAPVSDRVCLECHKDDHDDAFNYAIDIQLATCIEADSSLEK